MDWRHDLTRWPVVDILDSVVFFRLFHPYLVSPTEGDSRGVGSI
jgi:hypothetical protein